jgi:hypothetical protein
LVVDIGVVRISVKGSPSRTNGDHIARSGKCDRLGPLVDREFAEEVEAIGAL